MSAWVVVDGGYVKRPFLRRAAATGAVVVGRLRKDAALWSVPKASAQKTRGRPRKYGPDRISLAKRIPMAAGLGGGSADAAAALRLLAQLNGLSLDDERIIEVAELTGADVPVCVASQACVMTGVGETLQPLALPKMPCVMVNPCVPVATRDVFDALGLRNGELLVGAADVLLQDRSWPETDASIAEWIEAFVEVGNDLEAPAARIQPVITDVLSALGESAGVKLVRMSGSGATCFAIFADDATAQRAAEKIKRAHAAWWVHAGTLS